MSATKPPPPPEYLLADVTKMARDTVVSLDKPGRVGVLLDGGRFIVDDGRARAVGDSKSTGLLKVERIPPWLGGGFVFYNASTLFTSDTFDGDLNPIVSLPEQPARVSFGPKSMLVRGYYGGRWAFELSAPITQPGPQDPWGGRVVGARFRRAPVTPIGLVDIAALNDGRALALTEGGGVLMSKRHGETWDDITAKLAAPAIDVVVRGDDIFVKDESRHAYRLDKSGALVEQSDLPPDPSARQIERDPRWRSAIPPRDMALAEGARLDQDTAVVATLGDVALIDVRSGELKAITQGRLPPNLQCRPLRVPDDVVIVCAGQGSPSVVASGVLGDEGLHIERTFPLTRPFYASDDGSLVFAGPCSAEGSSPWAACARDVFGRWTEYNVESAVTRSEKDAVTQGNVEDVRWVPRAEKPPLAILVRSAITTVDPASGEPLVWKTESLPGELDQLIASLRPDKNGLSRLGGLVLDRAWSALADGSLRGWFSPGRSIDVSPKGVIMFSVFRFDGALGSGAEALARDKDQRLWQTLDRGANWVEVAAPLTGNINLQSCSPVGCNLGLWHRIGWEASSPEPRRGDKPDAGAPSLSRPTLPEIVCAPTGEPRLSTLSQTAASPADMGIGAARTPFSTVLPNGQILTYRRATYSRSLNNPPHSTRSSDETSPFVMVHNFAVEVATVDTPQGSVNTLVLAGPTANVSAFRQDVTFLAPFDPAGIIRSPTITLQALTAAARAAGTPLDEVLTTEWENEGFVPVLPVTPGAPADLVFVTHLVISDFAGLIMGGAKPSVRLTGLRRSLGTPISAAALPGGDIAVLVAGPKEGSHVVKLSATGATEIGGVPGSPPDCQPANPDALAVGRDGALAIIRTPSGDDPATAEDPALLIELTPGTSASASVPASKLIALAPWSTLTSAADPACKTDASGYRAVLQTKSPWIRLRGGERVEDALSTVMMAEVRWSASRVCLEALELPEGSTSLTEDLNMQTEIIARFAGPGDADTKAAKTAAPTKPDAKGGSAGRVGVALGAELRQSLSCSLASP